MKLILGTILWYNLDGTLETLKEHSRIFPKEAVLKLPCQLAPLTIIPAILQCFKLQPTKVLLQ